MSVKCELYPTMITPYNDNGSIDYDGIGNLISLFAKNNCDGVFAVCQSSEMFYLSVEEKLHLAKYCVDFCRQNGMKCVVSGHTEGKIDEQISYLKRLETVQADAVILVLNRLAEPDEDDDVLIERLGAIINELNPKTRLGVYECPYPYKRLLTSKIISFLIKTERFDFIKDTCCDIQKIRSRIEQLKGTSIKLFNANAATLAESLFDGATGYSGVMLNFVPELFRHLKESVEDRHLMDQIASIITLYSIIEYQNYPMNAKYLLRHRGIIKNELTRKEHTPLTESQKKEVLALYRNSECVNSKMIEVSNRELIFTENKYFQNCHASTILALDDGTVLIAYFAGSVEGADDVGIWLSRRVDGKWFEPVCIAKDENVAHWNPVLFKIDKGIRIVYRVGKTTSVWKCHTKVSTDKGQTWSDARQYEAPNDACGPVRSKPIYLSNNTLLAPDSVESCDSWQPRVDISIDQGETFCVKAQIPINHRYHEKANYMQGLGAIQPAIWESSSGHVHALLRTTSGYIYRSDSCDYGETWCEAYNTRLPNNNCGIEVVYSKGRLYLICNPISGNWVSRTPLVVKVSDDNGATFTDFCSLETFEYNRKEKKSAEFSYPSAVVCNGKLYVAYTFCRKHIAFCEIDTNSN